MAIIHARISVRPRLSNTAHDFAECRRLAAMPSTAAIYNSALTEEKS
jgi:hypothetical protein